MSDEPGAGGVVCTDGGGGRGSDVRLEEIGGRGGCPMGCFGSFFPWNLLYTLKIYKYKINGNYNGRYYKYSQRKVRS